MGLNIDASKLTPEGYTVLRNFGLAVSRYYRAKPQEGFFPLPSRSRAYSDETNIALIY